MLIERHTAPTATYSNTLQHAATHCNLLQHTTTHCSILLLCSTLPGRGWRRPIGCLKLQVIFRKVATNSRALWREIICQDICKDRASYDSMPPCTRSIRTKSTTLQDRTHCNTLQHTAEHCNTLQHAATHCNTLQHTATHCITLQRIAH